MTISGRVHIKTLRIVYSNINKQCRKISNYHFIGHQLFSNSTKIMIYKLLSKQNIQMNRLYSIMKNIIKHFINQRIIKATCNVLNVARNIINNLYNALKFTEKNVIHNDTIQYIYFLLSPNRGIIIRKKNIFP